MHDAQSIASTVLGAVVEWSSVHKSLDGCGLECPITHEPIKEPGFFTVDGHIYEKSKCHRNSQ
jgi:hypothetical protein